MTVPLFIVGAGGFGREVFSIIEALQSLGGAPHPAGFIDDAPSAADLERVRALGARVMGSVEDLVRRTDPFTAVLAIGSTSNRQTIAGLLAHSPSVFRRSCIPAQPSDATSDSPRALWWRQAVG